MGGGGRIGLGGEPHSTAGIAVSIASGEGRITGARFVGSRRSDTSEKILVRATADARDSVSSTGHVWCATCDS